MSTPDGFSDNPLVAEMERRCTDMLLVSQAVVTCADVFEQACEPRAPKPEWFGTGEGQWDSWWITLTSGRECLMRPATYEITPKGEFLLEGDPSADSGQCWPLKYVETVIPVARTGYPAPVGWKVVEE